MNNSVIKVSMLGDSSIEYNDKIIDHGTMRSKKIWSLLQFLIYNREREITSEELLALVYAEGSSANPQNALKTLMHRCRSVLDGLGCTDSKLMIIQQNGSYKWNKSLPLSLDAERFSSLYDDYFAAEGSADAFELCREALSLYKGDFLARFSLSWAQPLRERYKARYLTLVRSAIKILSEREEYDELVLVCRSAININRYDESLYLALMNALIMQGKPNIAMSVYNSVNKFFYRELGITPSDELARIYRQIVRSTQNVELDIGVIKQKLRESSENRGAFFCEYEFFKDIYRLEVRSAKRTEKFGHICLLTIVSSGEKSLSAKALSHIMEKLISQVDENLRRGDVFSRYSVCQLILLLPMTNSENALQIALRIANSFDKVNTHLGCSLTYSISPIDSAAAFDDENAQK